MGAPSRNESRKYSSTSRRTRTAVSASTRSLFVSATTPRFTPRSRQISKCSRVCGLIDSSAAITSSTRSTPAAPASMLLTKRSCPGTSTNPKRTLPSSRNAKPRSIVMPRRFSPSSRSGWVPVRASTSEDLPWSICPAVPTMMLFDRSVMSDVSVGKGSTALPTLRPRPADWRAYGHERQILLFGGGDFVHDGLRGGAGIGGGEDGPAHDQKIGARANRFAGSCGAGLIVVLGARGFVLWPYAGRNNQEVAPAGFANRSRFLHGGHDTINPGILGQL